MYLIYLFLINFIIYTSNGQVATSIENLNIVSDVYTSFIYRDLHVSVFRSIRNTTTETSNFRYQPIPIPILNEKCKYDIRVTKFFENYWIVYITLYIC